MIVKSLVKNVLETEPRTRERSNRYRAIWYILKRYYGDFTNEFVITKEMFSDVGPMILTITREINQLQQLDETLRGLDYEDGKKLSKEKQTELGYSI